MAHELDGIDDGRYGNSPYIYHYTFGLEFTTDGLPVSTIGDWSLDKRHYMGNYPPKQLEPPPLCAGLAARTLHSLFNEASGNISSWPTGTPNIAAGLKGTKGWGSGGVGGGVLASKGGALTDAVYRRSSLAQAAATRGPWKWGGEGPVLFFRGGRIYTPWGSGRWSLAGDAIGVNLGTCGTYRLVFNKARTGFSASKGHGAATSHGVIADGAVCNQGGCETKNGGADGANDDVDADAEGDDDDDGDGVGAAAAAAAAKWRRMSDSRFYKRLLGSGPWSWQGVTPLGFLGGGVLHTPWGAGTWEIDSGKDNTIRASFVSKVHSVTFDECWSFESTREDDGDKAHGVAKIDAPAGGQGAPKACPANL